MVIKKFDIHELIKQPDTDWLVVEYYDSQVAYYLIVKDGVVQNRVKTWEQAKKYMKQHKIHSFKYKEQYTKETHLLGNGGEPI